MTEKDIRIKQEQTAAENSPLKEDGADTGETRNCGKTESPEAQLKPKPHSVVYIKNEKTGEWEVKNPAGSYAYNYLSRDEFPDE